jgi:methyl-accepting chemotaxis protein
MSANNEVRSKASRLQRLRSTLNGVTSKFVLWNTALVTTVAAIVATIYYLQIERQFEALFRASAARTTTSASVVLSQKLPGSLVRFDEQGFASALIVSELPATDGHSMIDELAKAIVSDVSILTFDPGRTMLKRTTTSIRTKDGARALNVSFNSESPLFKAINERQTYLGRLTTPLGVIFVRSIPIIDMAGTPIGLLGAVVKADTLEAAKTETLRDFAMMAAPMIVFILGFSIFIGRRFVRVIAELATTMTKMAAGALDQAFRHSGRKDELGSISRSLESFQGDLRSNREKQADLDQITALKLTDKKRVDALIEDFRVKIVGVLAAVAGHAERGTEAAKTLSTATSIADNQAGQVAVASHQISAASQQIASAIEEMAASVSEVSRQTDASFVKVEAMANAAARTEDTIRRLSAAASQVGQVTDLIREVAEKTNLLSLNATIEAARAGEAGRGFAVVATEVKGLASQTSESTDEIGKLVKAMQDETADAVRSIEEMAKLTVDAQSATSAIATAIQQQQAVSSEIARSITETSRGSSELAQNIDGVSQVIRETAASADRAKSTSDDLSAKALEMRGAVDDFLVRVATAA